MDLKATKKQLKNLKRASIHSSTIQKILFKAILYGLVYKLSNKEKKIDKNLIKQILGKEFFDCFGKKDLLQLDKSFCNFEKKYITLPTRS